MRSLILFGVLALCFIVALGEIEQETEAVAADVIVREAREARRGRPKQKSLKRRNKGSRRGGKPGRRGKEKQRSSKRKNNGKRKGQKKGQRRGPSRAVGRQATMCNMTAVKVVFNIYTKSISLGRQANRAQKIYKQVNNKFGKCDTAFVKPAKVLGQATTDGTTCNKTVAPQSIQDKFTILNNCSVSSCELCNLTGLGVDIDRVKTCETELKNVSDTAAACLRSGDCSCLENPPTIPVNCDPYVTTVKDAVNGVKKQCTGSDVLGSFTNCSGIAKEVPMIAEECGKIEPNSPPSTATARARDLRGMFNKMML